MHCVGLHTQRIYDSMLEFNVRLRIITQRCDLDAATLLIGFCTVFIAVLKKYIHSFVYPMEGP